MTYDHDPLLRRANIREAHRFAQWAHGSIGQKRKYTMQDYIVHPEAVARMVGRFRDIPDHVVIAALLHDVVEDTPVTIDDIQEQFGTYVATLVDAVTDHTTPEMGNRAVRKELERDRLAMAPEHAQTIKMADIIDNTGSIVTRDPKFGKVYIQEMLLLLPRMQRAEHTLTKLAQWQVTLAGVYLGLVIMADFNDPLDVFAEEK